MSDENRTRAAIEARLRRAGGDRSPLARWVRLNRSWVERVLEESGASWAAVAEALVEEGVVPAPEGWEADGAAERAWARRRLADAVRQAWRRERVKRPGARPAQVQRPTGPAEPEVFAVDQAQGGDGAGKRVGRARPRGNPAPAAAVEDGAIERTRWLLDQRSDPWVPPETPSVASVPDRAPPARGGRQIERIRRVFDKESRRR
jgi:hypothetical protein